MTYDGDGKRVKSDITTNLGTTTTYFVGNHYEVTDGVVTKYYYAGSQRIAMRDNGTLFFLLGDHLGSTSLVTFGNGNVVSETRYRAWGEVRYDSGTTPTDYTYTGQYSYASDFGLMFYNARWYDPSLGRFAQSDMIVPYPYNSLDWDRYNYARNSPINYTDPTGHAVMDPGDNGTWWDKITPLWIEQNLEDPLDQDKMLMHFMIEHPEYSVFEDQELQSAGYDLTATEARYAVYKFQGEVYKLSILTAISKDPAKYVVDAILGTGSTLAAGIVLRGGPSGSQLTWNDLSLGGSLPDRNGLTTAGRALQKHGNRPGSAFPKVQGNPTTLNEAGQTIVDEILTTPGTSVKQYYRPGYGNIIDVYAPDGRGLRFDASTGKLIGFLEP